MTNDNKRKRTKAQMLEDAEIARVKASVTFTAPEIRRDDPVRPEDELKTQEDLDLTTTAIGSFDIKGNIEAEGEYLKALEVIADERPKEDDRPKPYPEDIDERFDDLYRYHSNRSDTLFFEEYKRSCKLAGIDCPNLSITRGPYMKIRGYTLEEIQCIPAAWRGNEEYKEKLEQFAINTCNKYLKVYPDDSKKAFTLASAEFNITCQIMEKNGLTPDSSFFRSCCNDKERLFVNDKEARGNVNALNEKAKKEVERNRLRQEKQAEALTQTQINPALLKNGRGRE
ncbi:MAG: hypothetical protein J6C85_04430 [Alphaproteobacteria bacterium]|nr:hypothetical protein [Alphaproteobacteria bacterium]